MFCWIVKALKLGLEGLWFELKTNFDTLVFIEDFTNVVLNYLRLVLSRQQIHPGSGHSRLMDLRKKFLPT